MTITPSQIYLGPVWIALFGGLLLLAILRGRPEWAVGMFFAMSGWNRNLWMGPLIHSYALLATMYLAAFVDIQVRLRRGEQVMLFPRHDRSALVLVGLWWFWMLLLIELFDPINAQTLRRNLLVLIIAAIPPIVVFADDLARLRGFALAYIMAAIAGGWICLAAYEIPITALLQDPGLNSYGLSNLGVRNYHAIAWAFGCALILVMALYIEARSLLAAGFYLLLAALCVQFLLLSLSRQSMASSLLCMALFGVWALVSRRSHRPRVLLLVLGVLVMVLALYQVAPNLVVRENESGLLEAFDLVGERSEYWRFGWAVFTASPLWGSGLTTPYSHNLALGTLAEQGLVGGFFLLAYFYFVARQARVIVNRRGDPERATWRVAFFLIVLFFVAHSMASGTAINGRHLYWGGLLLWFQSAIVRPAPLPALSPPTRLIARPRPLAPAPPATD